VSTNDPTAIRCPRAGKAHRPATTIEAHARGYELPVGLTNVTGCGKWSSKMTEWVLLSEVLTTERCKKCWSTTKEVTS
jgi:hypothetical protein